MANDLVQPSELAYLPGGPFTDGEVDAAVASLRQAVDKYAHEAAYNIAYAEAWRGNADAAFEWLGKAVEYKDTGLVMVASDPILKQLNGDPRWLAFLRSQGRAPDQLAAIRLDIDLGRSGDP